MALEQMKVRVLRPFYFERKTQEVDRVMNLPKIFALEMAAARKVEIMPAEEESKAIKPTGKQSDKKSGGGDAV